MQNLFTLSSYEDGATETSELFKGSEVRPKRTRNREFITPGADAVPIVDVGEERPAGGQPEVKDDERALRRIAGVAGVEEYQEGSGAAPASEEDRLMQGIFAQSAVHSALEHDHIMSGGSNKVQADPQILRAEANRVAAGAAAHLRRAGEQARNVPIGTVTWTGEVGEAGRPANVRRRGGPSSAGILTGIADRQGLGGSSSAGSSSRSSGGGTRGNDFEKMVRSAPPPSPTLARTDGHLPQIPNFIRRHGGQVPSKLLVDHFNQWCTGARQADEFKKALHRVAHMKNEGSSLRVIWELNPQFA